MKKRILNPLLTFILGALIFGGIGVASAYGILANNIGYTPGDSSWKKANGEDITNVKDAIDELYSKAGEYKKLDITTTATSSDILNGKTAYDNFGNLITGNVSTDCVSGSFICDSDCNGSNGKQILSFKPRKFFMHPDTLPSNVLFYDDSLYTSIWDLFPNMNWVEYKSPNYSNVFTLDDTGLYAKNWNWNNTTTKVYYIACK